MAGSQSNDNTFVTFIEPVWGIRALARILLSYHRQGVTTVRQAITRWAPPTENDTAAYITTVARTLNLNPDEQTDFSAPSVLLRLVTAVIRQENGCQPYSLETIAHAIKLALPDNVQTD